MISLPPLSNLIYVTLKGGRALAIPEADHSFDGVLMVMLMHHLIGKTNGESLDNTRGALREGFRVLKPEGKLIRVESCVARWFYRFEKVFSIATVLINSLVSHPVTLQYPAPLLAASPSTFRNTFYFDFLGSEFS